MNDKVSELLEHLEADVRPQREALGLDVDNVDELIKEIKDYLFLHNHNTDAHDNA